MPTNKEALAVLKQALRYIEVQMAYTGSMTAAQVEDAIRMNRNIARTEIAANSVTTLASFNIGRARKVIAELEQELTDPS